jgi:hypothetical protein
MEHFPIHLVGMHAILEFDIFAPIRAKGEVAVVVADVLDKVLRLWVCAIQ